MANKTNLPFEVKETEPAPADFLAVYDALNESVNVFKQKIKITKKYLSEGKPKLDKDGQLVLNEFGEVQKWEDKFQISFVSLENGGEHSCYVCKDSFNKLKEGTIYIACGEVDYKLYKDSFNSTPIIRFDSFVSEREHLAMVLGRLGDIGVCR